MCYQGDQGDEFFIIIEGLASVTQCPSEGEQTKEVKEFVFSPTSSNLTLTLSSVKREQTKEVKEFVLPNMLESHSGRATRPLGLLW